MQAGGSSPQEPPSRAAYAPTPMKTSWTDGELRYSYSELDDLELFVELLAKDSVCEHVFFGPNSREMTLGFFEPLVKPMCASLERGEAPEAHVFTLRRAADDSFVGQCAVIPVAFGRDHYQIGYQIDEPFWRQGIGTRAAEFTLHHGFGTLGADRLSADCLSSNAGSVRILTKCGFKQEGHQRRQFWARGAYHDQRLFGLLREEVTLDLGELAARYS